MHSTPCRSRVWPTTTLGFLIQSLKVYYPSDSQGRGIRSSPVSSRSCIVGLHSHTYISGTPVDVKSAPVSGRNRGFDFIKSIPLPQRLAHIASRDRLVLGIELQSHSIYIYKCKGGSWVPRPAQCPLGAQDLRDPRGCPIPRGTVGRPAPRDKDKFWSSHHTQIILLEPWDRKERAGRGSSSIQYCTFPLTSAPATKSNANSWVV